MSDLITNVFRIETSIYLQIIDNQLLTKVSINCPLILVYQ